MTLRPMTVDHFKAYSRLMVLDNGRPAEWEGWELELADDALEQSPSLRELWSIVPEGSGKTTFVAAFALYHADHVDSAEVNVAARDRDQANRLLEVAGGIVKRSPGMEDRFQLRVHGLRVIRAKRTDGRIKVYAHGEGADGVGGTLNILDELHLHPSLTLYSTWRGKLTKRDGLLWVISTAGEPDGEFEQARAKARDDAEDVRRRGCHVRSRRRRVVVHDWALPEGADPLDLDAVLEAQPSTRITRDDLQDKLDAPGFRMSSWLRRTCNRPAREHNTAVSDLEWAACMERDCRVPDDCPDPVIGADLAFRGDWTGVVMVGSGSDELGGRLVVDRDVAGVEPPGDGTSTQLERVLEPFVRLGRRITTGEPIRVNLDPSRDGETLAQALEDREMLARLLGIDDEQADELPRFDVVVVAQRTPALIRMTSRTMEAIRDRRLAHPDSAILTRHLMAGTLVTQVLGDQRFDRPARGVRQPIDCATALLHAVDGWTTRQTELAESPVRAVFL